VLIEKCINNHQFSKFYDHKNPKLKPKLLKEDKIKSEMRIEKFKKYFDNKKLEYNKNSMKNVDEKKIKRHLSADVFDHSSNQHFVTSKYPNYYGNYS